MRDSKTDEFWEIAEAKGVTERINLIHINKLSDLEDMYDDSDFVAFVAQARIVKDVPNSLLDGLAFGKPIIISKVLDFWTIVEKQDIGYVFDAGDAPKRMKITADEYRTMSEKAYSYSKQHTPANYQKSATRYEEYNENSNS